jgi:cytochrome c peroxidase
VLRQEYRRPPPRPVENACLVALGRALFFEPRLSASGTTACASCHFPALGWGVTEAKSRNDSGKLTSRKSQPLIGSAMPATRRSAGTAAARRSRRRPRPRSRPARCRCARPTRR